MKWFQNLKVAYKLIICFIFMAVISSIVGIIGVVNINKINVLDEDLYTLHTSTLGDMVIIAQSFERERGKLRDIIIQKNSTDKQACVDKIKLFEKTFDESMASFEKGIKDNDKEKAYISTLKKNVEEFRVVKDKIVNLALANQDEQASDLLFGDGLKIANTVQNNIDELTQFKVNLAKDSSNINNSTAKTAIYVMLGVILFSIFIAIVLGIFIARMISKPVEKMVQVAESLALGDVDVIIEANTKDEIGDLMKSFGIMINNIRMQAETANKIAAGDLNVEVKINSEKDMLGKSMKQVVMSLQELVNESKVLTDAAIKGNLGARGNEEKFKGGYKDIIAGVNNILDAVIEPIKEASQVLNEVANGNLKVKLIGDYKGDHAVIKEALNNTIENISSYINEISEVLTEMANGNLNISVTGNYMGDFIEIKNSLNRIIDSFNRILSDINSASEQVAAGSKQISDSAQELSQGSTEQASSTEQLTASLEEISAQTQQNAANANEANDTALIAKEVAMTGDEQMKQMLSSINDINEASGNISKIIKVIEEIAFQTNILALNAAVEAARAGQHGKGFAVVAEEVRNLAARSANAAKETTALIESSIRKSEDGNKIANKTAEALNKIVDAVTRAAGLVGEIAVASSEQAAGISQINQGIMQISQVVQINSTTSEECASASEELSSQAEILRDLVSKFKLKNTGSNYNEIENLNPEVLKMLQNMKETKSFKNEIREIKTNTNSNSKINISLSDKEFGKY